VLYLLLSDLDTPEEAHFGLDIVCEASSGLNLEVVINCTIWFLLLHTAVGIALLMNVSFQTA
jgi:hypothetical protein